MNRVRKLKFVLWAALGLAAAVASARFFFGLGTTTNLSDANPWGVWIGFDVMGGVALAAGGFIVTATVYIFKVERFHSIVRSAVLTAFLGYVAVALSLVFDLGLPWNIWHMIIYWNPHSPLFEVGWCVMLYLSVLTLEFLPVPAEEFPRLAKVRTVLVKVRLPLVIVGIGLSTLHQSSLGSLFLIMPYRLYPLWYSPILPLLFLISAIGLGLQMVIFENHLTAYLYRRKPESELLTSFASAARWVLLVYVLIRFGDLLVRHQGRFLFALNAFTALFWFELMVMVLAPVILFSMPRVRDAQAGQYAVATLGVLGVVLNRIDTGGLAHVRPEGGFYLPAWTEVATSVGILSAVALVFFFFIERFRIWEERPADPAAERLTLPEFDAVGTTWLGVPSLAARTLYSLAFILAAALGFALLAPQRLHSRGTEPTSVHQARGGNILWIDGNLDGFGVAFKHAEHEKREGEKESCIKCHHMNYPRDRNTPCSRCHFDMYLPVDAFRHDWHASLSGAGVACYQCHTQGQSRGAANAARCDRCHKDLVPAGALIEVKKYRAASYTDAMHQLCLGCHAKKAVEKKKPEMTQCAWCHKESRDVIDDRALVLRRAGLIGRGIVLPPASKPGAAR